MMRRAAVVAAAIVAVVVVVALRAGSDDGQRVSYRCRYTQPQAFGVFVRVSAERPSPCDPDGTLEPGAIGPTDVVTSAKCGPRQRAGSWYFSSCTGRLGASAG